MKIQNCLFVKSFNKIPVSKQTYTFEQVIVDKVNEYTLILNDEIICFDIDAPQSRQILVKAKEMGFLDKFVYTYKPNNDSFHFFFKKTNPNLRNKNTYTSLSGIDFEVLTDKVVAYSNEIERYNFDQELSDIDDLFYAIGSKKANYLYKPSPGSLSPIERVLQLINSVEGEKRSLNIFVLLSHWFKKENVSEEQLEKMMNWYNQIILWEPLSQIEVKNNIKQILGQEDREENNGGISSKDLDMIIDSSSKTPKISKERLSEYLITKYKMFIYNDILYLFFDDKYLMANNFYKKIPNILYFIISNEFKIINQKSFIFLDLTNDLFMELLKILYKKAVVLNELNDQILIRVNNGVLLVEEQKTTLILDEEGKYKTPNWFDMVYDKKIQTNEKIDKFLISVFKNHDLEEQNNQIKMFYELVGMSLLTHNKIRKAIIFKGKGKNGKSALINFMKRFVGIQNISALSLDQINQQFGLNEMMNKTLNINDEMTAVLDTDSHIFKSLISSGYISTDIKYENTKKWINYATLVFASNYVLRVQKYNNAIAERLHIISLNNRFDKKDEIKNIWEYLLNSPEDYSYMLNMSLLGIQRLIKSNWNFSQTKNSLENMLIFMNDNSPIRNYLISKNFCENNEINLVLTNHGVNFFDKTNVINCFKDFSIWYELSFNKKCTFGLLRFKEQIDDELSLKMIYKENQEFFDVNHLKKASSKEQENDLINDEVKEWIKEESFSEIDVKNININTNGAFGK